MASATVLAVLGTRPEVIKMAPVIGALRGRAPRLRTVVVASSQHRERLQRAARALTLEIAHDLGFAQLVGSSPARLRALLERSAAAADAPRCPAGGNPFGPGDAGERIARAIERYLGTHPDAEPVAQRGGECD